MLRRELRGAKSLLLRGETDRDAGNGPTTWPGWFFEFHTILEQNLGEDTGTNDDDEKGQGFPDEETLDGAIYNSYAFSFDTFDPFKDWLEDHVKRKGSWKKRFSRDQHAPGFFEFIESVSRRIPVSSCGAPISV